jgi:hypothetical protein
MRGNPGGRLAAKAVQSAWNEVVTCIKGAARESCAQEWKEVCR